jgi:hypothetical protein
VVLGNLPASNNSDPDLLAHVLGNLTDSAGWLA